MAEINDLNVVDAGNTGRFPEGQSAPSLNDGARALEGLIARWHKDTDGSLTTGGTGTAYTLTPNRVVPAYYNGLEFRMKFHVVSGASPTIDVNALGAKALVWPDGTAIAAAEIAANEVLFAVYDGTNFRILTPGSGTPIKATGSTTPRTLKNRLAEIKNVRDYGAVGDDVTDDSAAFAAARAAAGSARPIIGINGDFNQAGETALFGATNPTTSDDALGFMMYLGSDVSPATRHEPLIRLEKFTNSDRSVEASAYDQGALYVTVTRAGTPSTPSPAPAVNFYARAEQDANVIGAHMRGAAEAAGASAWGGWSYAQTAVTNPDRLIAHEFNLRNTGAASAWSAGAPTGAISGIVVATADSGLPCTHGIRISDITSGLTGGFRTAINIDESACVGNSGTLFQNGEAIYIAGGATVGERIGAVRLGAGNFLYGFSTHEATINNACALLLADNHRISWGTEPNSGSWLSFNGTNFDFNGLLDLSTPTAELRIDSVKVVDARITGWATATGVATRTTFATSTVTLSQLAERVKALIDDLFSHGLIGT